MAKEDFSRRVLEQQIFDELKDTPVISSEYFRRKYNGTDIDYSRLYRRIVNHQVQQYGCTLNTYVSKRTEDLILEHRKARQRRYERKNRRYENNRFTK